MLVFSLVLHASLLFALGRNSIPRPAAEMPPIAVTILAAAPPPPPPAAAARAGRTVVEQPVSKAPDSVARDKPTRKAMPREARKPRIQAAPAAEAAVAQEPRSGGVDDGVEGGTPGGVEGGVVGGVEGGVVGGTLGGTGDEPIRAELVASPPSVLSQVRPQYPPIARARGLEGVVVLELIVDREGRVEGEAIKVKQSAKTFDAPAIEAVRQWRFRPGRDEGNRAVRVLLEVPIRFQLR